MIDASGTWFQGVTVHAKVRSLIAILGTPDCGGNDGNEKTNYEWARKTDGGDVFTVYDWKEYRPLDDDEIVEWHIGARSRRVAEQARDLIATTPVLWSY